MKTKSLLVLCLVVIRLSAISQVKIGDNSTTVNSASLLELETTDKGFVLPRVSITSVNASSPLASTLLTGTIVYNTNSGISGGSGVGIYYWDGSKWNFIANTSVTSNNWSLTGNGGTNASTNFIGTTDAIDFSARTNNIERMRILGANNGSSKAGWIGMGITVPRSSLDVTGDYTNKNVLTLQNTSSTGFTSVDMLDNTGSLKGTFGYANTGTSGNFSGRTFFNSYGSDLLFTANSGTYHLFLKGGTGYIGINTNTPSERLHVVGNFYLNGAFMPGGSAGTSGYVLTSAGANTSPTWTATTSFGWGLTGNAGTSYATNFLGTTDNVSMRFRTNNLQRMIIDSVGKVGIGLSNPSYALSVLSAANPLYLSGVQTSPLFSADSLLTINAGVVRKVPYVSLLSVILNGSNPAWLLTGNSGTSSLLNFMGTSDNVSLRFRTNNVQRMIIDSIGRIGIGLNNPGNALSVLASSNPLYLSGVQNTTTLSTDSVLTINAGIVKKTAYASFSTATSNTLSLSGNTLTSTVNGVADTSKSVSSVSNGSSANTLSTTVNGVTGSGVSIINSNTKTWTQTGGLTTTVNGIASNVTPASGTVSNVLGYSSTGAPVYQSAANILTGSTTHTIALNGNTITSTVNGVSDTTKTVSGVSNTSNANSLSTTVNGVTSSNVSIINSNANAWTQADGLTTTVNGVTATITPVNGTINNLLGYNASGAPVYQSLNNLNLSTAWNLLGNAGTTSANFLGTTDNVSMRFKTNNTQRMIIDSLGRIGIGLNNPGNALSVLASSNPLYLSGVQNTTTLSADSILTINAGVVKKTPSASLNNSWDLTGNNGTNYATNFLGTTDNVSMRFRTNNVQRLIIDSVGNVGIGTSSPAAPLNISTTGSPGIISDRVSPNNFGSAMVLRKARDLISAAGALQASDILGLYTAAGSYGNGLYGSSFNSGMAIIATENWTSTAQGTELLFRNTANGASSFTYNMGIKQNGYINMSYDAGATVPYAKLHVNSTSGPSAMTALNGTGMALTGDHFYFENPSSASGQRVFSFANAGGVFTINANTNDASATAPSTSLPGAIALKASNGYVGINTNNPLNQLHVTANSDPLRLTGLQAATSAYSILTINNGGVVKYRLLSDIGKDNFWSLTGNSGTDYATNFLGTTDNVSMRFRTNNVQRMIIDSTGSVGIGSSAFNALNKEKLLIDYGTTTSNTLANLKGSIDGYFQVNLQNRSAGTNSSTDYVATANDGTDSTYYVDLGINGGNYVSTEDNWGGPHDAYLYTYGRNLVIGSQTTNGDILFLLGGGRSKYNAVLRMDGATGNLIVGKGENQNNSTGNIIRGPNGGSGTNIPGGSLTLQGGASNGNTAGGNLNLFGGGTVSGTYGSVNINASTNSATNINTGTSASNITIGGNANNIVLPKFNTVGGMYYTSLSTGQISTTGSNMTWDSINNRLGIGVANPGYKLSVLASSDPLYLSGVQATSTFTSDSILTINGGVVRKTPYSSLPSGSGSSSGWSLAGNSITSGQFLGTTNSQSLIFKSYNNQIANLDGNTSVGNIAIGLSAVNNSSDHNVAIGYGASTSNQYVTSLGSYATATGVNAVAIGGGASGFGAKALGAQAVAIGYNVNVTKDQTIGIGYQAQGTGQYGVAIGYNPTASGIQSNAIGYQAQATAQYSNAFGYQTQATGLQSNAIGYQAQATAQYSNAIGYQAQATGTQSVAIGYQAQTSQSNAIVLGNAGTANLYVGIGTSTPSAKLHIAGNATNGNNPLLMTGLPTGSSSDNLLTINSSGVVGSLSASSLGGSSWNLTGNAATSGNFLGTTNSTPLQFKFNNTNAGYLDANNTYFGTNASASNNATAIGANAVASQANNTAVGNSATANTSSQATAIGASSQALFQNNVAVGYNAQATSSNQETVIGASALAQGQNNISIGYSAKAYNSNQITVVGSNAQASFQNNTVLGYNAQAVTNNQATSIGAGSDASAQNATSLGYAASASGINATAVGDNTTASAQNASAFGNNASATGQNSTAIGNNATTSQANAIVFGNSSANVGIGTSTPNTTTKLDVDGKFKLGDVGTVNKNVVSFASTLGSTNLSAGTGGAIVFAGNVTFTASSTDVTITIPSSANYLSTTQATVSVSPNFDLPTGVSIASARMISTSQVKVRFVNASTTAQTVSGSLYITINEF